MNRIGSLRSGVACVYEIRNTVTNRVYIGSTARFAVRFTEHKRMLEAGKHHSNHLQNSYNKHGAIAFEMRVIEILPHLEFMVSREQWWLNKHGIRKTYNCLDVSGGGGHKAKPIFSICAKTGVVTRHETPQDAAITVTGTRDKVNQIHKAARNMRKARERYWTYDGTETLESFICRKARQKKQRKAYKVYAFTMSGVLEHKFTTIKEAADHYGVSVSAVSLAIHSGFRRCGAGRLWSNEATTPSESIVLEFQRARQSAQIRRRERERESQRDKPPVRKQVRQLRRKTLEVVRVYESLTMAATITPKATLTGVSECARGVRRHHAGYVWEFVKN